MPQIPHTVVRKTTGSLTNAVRLGLIGQHMNIFRNFSRAVLRWGAADRAGRGGHPRPRAVKRGLSIQLAGSGDHPPAG